MIYSRQNLLALETQLAANQHIAQIEDQAQQLQESLQNQQSTSPDPKAAESLTALMELAKALKLVEPVAA